MALALGTNCGFCTEAPVADPGGGTAGSYDQRAWAIRDTAPATAGTITEIGFWVDNATEEANFEVGVYAHDAGDDEPGALLDSSTTNAKGTTAGWKTATGLNFSITAETIYWIAIQLDDTPADATDINNGTVAGTRWGLKLTQDTLPEPWGDSTANYEGNTSSTYAIWEAGAPAGGGRTRVEMLGSCS